MSDRTMPPLGFSTKPMNIEAEQALLGAILINNEAYHRVAEFLRQEHFHEPVHGRIYAAIERLVAEGKIADGITLRREFDSDPTLRDLDGAQYLARLARAAETIINAEDYGRHLHDLAMKRALIAAAEETINAAMDPTDNTPAIVHLERSQSILDAIALDQPTESWRSVAQISAGMAERLLEPAEIFTTGLPTLDQSMAGGIHRGSVYGIEARMKNFKTGTLGTIALSLMRQNVPLLFVALEMGAERVMERLIAHETRCNAIRFRQRQDPADLVARVEIFGARYGARRAHFEDAPGLSFGRLRRLANAAVIKLGVKVMFVDYWQLITGCDRGQLLAQHHAETAQWLAAFAARHNVAVVIASQENRNGQSYASDGLAKACDWLGELNKVDVVDKFAGRFEGLWLNVKFNRDGEGGPLGSETSPVFRIDKLGPVLREAGDWQG